MGTYRIERIRFPDEFRYPLHAVSKNFAAHAEMERDGSGVTLSGLSPAQSLAHSVLMLGSEVDEVIDNLNLVMGDLERLGASARAFADRDPFQRFQFLFRMYFYEYARFEDVFAYFTKWQQEQALMTKSQRKESRDKFYAAFEDAFRLRNLLTHDLTGWRECTPEIAILRGLELTGQQAIDASGKVLTWEDHLRPICERFLLAFLNLAHPMRTFWNMEMAHLALALVEKGLLKKATKPFEVEHPAFLKPGRPDR